MDDVASDEPGKTMEGIRTPVAVWAKLKTIRKISEFRSIIRSEFPKCLIPTQNPTGNFIARLFITMETGENQTNVLQNDATVLLLNAVCLLPLSGHAFCNLVITIVKTLS